MVKIQYLIYLYMALCACMMIYNIVYTLYNRTTERNIEKQKNGFIKKIKNQISLVESGITLLPKHRKYLYNKLKRTHNLLLFEQILDEQTQEIRKKYIENIENIFCELAIYYQNSDNIKKAYFAYIVGKYKIEHNTITNTLFMFLDEEAMYCRDNSIKAIVRLGKINNIIKVFKEISKSSYYYSVEMLFENLLKFDGDKEILSEKMWQEFWEFNKNIQIAIIKFITKSKLNYSEEFLRLLNNKEINNEIKVELIKYFKDNTCPEVESLLINYTKYTGILNRELVIESAKILSAYNSIEVKDALKELLKRNDWDIRMVASESLSILGTSYYELAEIYNSEDNVARRILRYKIQNYKYTNMNPKIEVS